MAAPSREPDASRLRVLQLIPTLQTGGLESVAARLAIALQERVESVLVATAGGLPFSRTLADAGVRIRIVPRPRPQPGRLVVSAFALARLLREERPHVVHAHNPAAGVVAGLARLLAGDRRLAVVTTYHGVMAHRVGRASLASALASDLVVGVGPQPTRALLAAGLPRSRSATVFNGVDVHPSRPPAETRRSLGVEDAELVVTVGRYVPEKDHALLLDALALLAPARPRLRALLVGYGELEDDLRRRIDALALSDRVTLTGPRADAVDLTAAADVFALSSISEGLPLGLIEAMSLARPIAATAVGGIPDVLAHERSGLLVPARDAGALAAALARLLDDRLLAARLGREAQAFAERHCSEARMVERYLVLYAAAVAGRSG
jgi:glycosyltransferase involved in cell wall biosynthesis